MRERTKIIFALLGFNLKSIKGKEAIFETESEEFLIEKRYKYNEAIETLRSINIEKETYSLYVEFSDMSYEEHLEDGNGFKTYLKIKDVTKIVDDLISQEIQIKNWSTFFSPLHKISQNKKKLKEREWYR